jgi:hypothetical protein
VRRLEDHVAAVAERFEKIEKGGEQVLARDGSDRRAGIRAPVRGSM